MSVRSVALMIDGNKHISLQTLMTKFFPEFLANTPSTPYMHVCGCRKLISTQKESPWNIHPIEKSLPHPSRTKLTQLCFDFWKELKSYQARIRSSPDNVGPLFWEASRTTAHLSSCPAAPTTQTIRDMWSHPCETVNFFWVPFFI
jgi:hypothetical protein